MDYSHPLLYDEDSPDRSVEVVLKSSTSPNQAPVSFEVVSYSPESARTSHCTGIIKAQQLNVVRDKFARQAASAKRQAIVVGTEQNVEKINTRLMYEVIFTRVVTYSKGYQSVRSMSISSSGNEGYGVFRLPEEH